MRGKSIPLVAALAMSAGIAVASSDEDRTRRLFQTLSEAVRTGHQVLVLTCHRAKIEAAKSMDPAWFADSVAFTELAPEAVRRNP